MAADQEDIAAYRRAIECLTAGDAASALNIARTLSGRLSGIAAIDKLRGITELAAGDTKSGVDFLLLAHTAEPGDIDTAIRLARGHERLGQWSEAAKAYFHVIARDPSTLDGQKGLLALAAQIDDDEVARRLAEAWSRATGALDIPAAAVRLLRRLGGSSAEDDFLRLFSFLLMRIGQTKQAVAAISLTGCPPETAPTAPPAAAIERMEAAAADYGEDRWSRQVAKAFAAFVGRHTPARCNTLVDVGCGDGAIGEALRGRADVAIGVDLARNMLDRAAARGAYDRLDRADMLEWMTAHSECADLLLCSWTLLYLPDTEPFFRAARTALRPGGMLAINLYLCDDRSGTLSRWRHMGGEYLHSRKSALTAAAAPGLRLEHEEIALLACYPGWYAVFSRPA